MLSSTDRSAGRSVSADPSPWRTHPLSDSLQVGIGFLPHPSPAVSSASFAVRLPSRGGNGGYFVPLFGHSGVGSCLSAGGASSATGDIATPAPGHVPFGPSLTASWARLCLRALSALHLG